MGWENLLRLIETGEPVSAGVANRTARTLDGNVRYLGQLLDAASVGSTVFAREVAVEPDARVGMPLYYNKDTGRFERCLAVVEIDQSAAGAPRTAAKAKIWGVLFSKHTGVVGDLLLFG